jgi:hypothetical protein
MSDMMIGEETAADGAHCLQDPDRPILGLDGRCLRDFWQWAYSDILSNTNRPILAEYVVGSPLGPMKAPRIEWDTTDLAYRGHTIEVKSAAYVQTWKQTCPSVIRFDISEHQRWNAEIGLYEDGTCRHADCYVFCLLAEPKRNRVDPLDLTQWEFYVMATSEINRIFGGQKTVALSRIQDRCSPISYNCLKDEVDRVLFPEEADSESTIVPGKPEP